MKIVIPEEYREHFPEDIAFITWGKKPTLLLMNREERECLQKSLDKGAWVRFKGGDCEHISLGLPIIELVIKNGVIDIPVPDDPKRRLQGENRAFTRDKAGIALS